MTGRSIETDILVIGGGAAGSVVAGRLAMHSKRKVLLVEAGGRDRHPFYRIPLMTGTLAGSARGTWRRTLEPEPETGDRTMIWPQGRVLGGSASINGMVWMRGRPSDYDGWAETTSPDWSGRDVSQVFDRIERRASASAEIAVPIAAHDGTNPLYAAFVAAAAEAGLPVTDDLNQAPFEGAGRFAVNVANGQRWSSARTYLDPARARSNLHILTGARPRHVRIDGRRATGATIVLRDREVEVRARETIVCAGAVNSPALLMASGIGGAATLLAANVVPIVDLPGVGENLQDHLCARVSVSCLRPVSLHGATHIDRAAWAFLRAYLWRRGVAASPPFGAGFILRSSPELSEPDLEGVFVPALSTAKLRAPALLGAVAEHAYTCAVFPLRPKSRGRITLRPGDAFGDPVIRAGYLTDPDDLALTRRGLRLVRDIFAQPAFAPFRGEELLPGCAVQSDAGLDAVIARTANTAFHPAGTCRMGRAEDPMAVVDPQLRVHGIDGLRVADASIMPTITSGNTSAPAMMIGYRCADMLLADG